MKQLINNIAEQSNLTKKASKELIESIFDYIFNETQIEGKFKCSLGTFKIKERAGRVGRNPSTGEPIDIKAKKVLTFKQSTEITKLL